MLTRAEDFDNLDQESDGYREFRDLQNESHESDAAEERADMIAEAKAAATEHLQVHDNVTGPGFYIGDRDDPETMEWALREDKAYEILEHIKDEYLENM